MEAYKIQREELQKRVEECEAACLYHADHLNGLHWEFQSRQAFKSGVRIGIQRMLGALESHGVLEIQEGDKP